MTLCVVDMTWQWGLGLPGRQPRAVTWSSAWCVARCARACEGDGASRWSNMHDSVHHLLSSSHEVTSERGWSWTPALPLAVRHARKSGLLFHVARRHLGRLVCLLACLLLVACWDFQGVETARVAGSRNSVSTHLVSPCSIGLVEDCSQDKAGQTCWCTPVFGTWARPIAIDTCTRSQGQPPR